MYYSQIFLGLINEILPFLCFSNSCVSLKILYFPVQASLHVTPFSTHPGGISIRAAGLEKHVNSKRWDQVVSVPCTRIFRRWFAHLRKFPISLQKVPRLSVKKWLCSIHVHVYDCRSFFMSSLIGEVHNDGAIQNSSLTYFVCFQSYENFLWFFLGENDHSSFLYWCRFVLLSLWVNLPLDTGVFQRCSYNLRLKLNKNRSM